MPVALKTGRGVASVTMRRKADSQGWVAGAIAAWLAVVVGSPLWAESDLAEGVERLPAPPAVAEIATSMRLEEMPLLELPEVASSGEWFSSSGWYGGSEVLFFDRSRVYRQDNR